MSPVYTTTKKTLKKENSIADPDPLVRGSVVDPYSFFPDPDPEFDVEDQYGSGSGSNTDPGL